MREIEPMRKLVLERLDMSRDISDEELYERIDEVLMEICEKEYFPLAERLYCRTALYDSFRRLDVLSEALDMEGVTEVMVNGPKQIFVERKGRLEPFGKCFSSREKLEDVVQQIVARVNRRVNEASPMVDARLEDGSRVNIVLPPAALDGPVITVRRFHEQPPDMEQLIQWGALTCEAAEFLKILIQARYHIFISGGTGSGKTTFLGALAGYIDPADRVITIEDSAELRLVHVHNLVRLETRSANQDGQYEITIRDLIRNSLRMRPDWIIVGEIRGKEALDMLQAMATGHSGLSTGHANSAEDMIRRIEAMSMMGSDADMPLPAIRAQIISAIDIVVHLGRLRDKQRKILSINEVMEGESGEIYLNRLYEFQERGEKDGRIEGELKACKTLSNTRKLRDAGFVLSASGSAGT